MSEVKNLFANLLSEADDLLDTLRTRIKHKLQLHDPIEICAYRTYGSDEVVHVSGRVLEHKGLEKAKEEDRLWDNIVNMYMRMESDEIPGAKIKIYFQDAVYETVTDNEGYFHAQFKPNKPLNKEEMWQEVEIEIVDSPIELKHNVRTKAYVQTMPHDSEFGIISDMDDTVIQSFATDRIKMFKTVVMNNARTRSPFDGVSAFYKALKLGANGTGDNPFFYVSSSPWNLHDFLLDFLEVHDVPIGPLLLRDIGVSSTGIGGSSHRAHKYVHIERILNTYPDKQFILIGDSGQKDPVIYHEVIKNFPDRILVAYIRDVALPERSQIVMKISEELGTGKTPMVLVENTLKAAEHAVGKGYIASEMLDAIKVEKVIDEKMKEESKPAKKQPEEVKQEVQKDIVQKELKKDDTGGRGDRVL